MKYEKEIYDILDLIPKGKVMTYKDISLLLGSPNLSRVVGNVLHNNKNPKMHPCYKVVNTKGKLANNFAFGGKEGQKRFLEKEGIEVINYTVNLLKYRWSNL